MSNYKQVKAETFESFKFEKPGDLIEGVLVGIETRQSVHGTMEIAKIRQADKCYSIIISAGLKIYDLADYIGFDVQITYEGEKTNVKTKRKYKSYKLGVGDKVVNDDDFPF